MKLIILLSYSLGAITTWGMGIEIAITYGIGIAIGLVVIELLD